MIWKTILCLGDQNKILTMPKFIVLFVCFVALLHFVFVFVNFLFFAYLDGDHHPSIRYLEWDTKNWFLCDGERVPNSFDR